MPVRYEALYNNPIMAYAHHRVVFDATGTPWDYEFWTSTKPS